MAKKADVERQEIKEKKTRDQREMTEKGIKKEIRKKGNKSSNPEKKR